MSTVRYSEDHEWVRLDGDIATVGITNHAQEQLGDIVYVELPEAGRTLERGEEFAVVESVKAASEVYAPVAGEIVELNEAIVEDPSLVNASADKDGWFVKIKVAGPEALEGLMDEAAYKAFAEENG